MSPPVAFAIIGCGQIARKHADILTQRVPGARLAAVCDVDRSRAEAAGAAYGVPAFDGIAPMMRAMADRIDVVSVLTPSGYHAENVRELLGSGARNVLVEKPMALRLEDAEEMIDACRRQGTRLFVVKQNRFNTPVQALERAVREGRFGKFVLATARVRWCRKQPYYDQGGWRGTWQFDGGVFANQACHHVDLLAWLLGEVESVFAYTATRLARIEAEDTGVAVLRFRNGALGVVEATTATRPKDLEGSLSVLGERGAVEIGGFSANALRSWQFDPPSPADDAVRQEHAQNPQDVPAYAHVEYLRRVVDCVHRDQAAIVDGEEGIKSLRLVHAIYESAATGAEVRMAGFRPQHSRLGREQ